MALYLVQHGKSLTKDIDPEQGLSKDGIDETHGMADTARKYRVSLSSIIHSTKKRARETAEILAETLKPAGGISEKNGLKPMDNVAEFSKAIKNSDHIMVVGHLPFMEKLTSYLVTGSPDPVTLKFQNSGIVCLDKDPDTQSWYIKWTLMPNIS